ncbi:Beta-glucanase, GH16 family [Actinacidiphila yanglinensis]|uniref:Beta-glucanase, GH16 family n=1 Tax=Actinacidiphila yanglinensis TaxID=310779 RepID=A0A1H6DFK6_9ACTN|nr:glycoside hydrolase family 16 protein [Actinacidiphila yanglinensis]SEG83485.1 Beta-glucanase, GH16 family [Actinacidiphila yanglinensis]
MKRTLPSGTAPDRRSRGRRGPRGPLAVLSSLLLLLAGALALTVSGGSAAVAAPAPPTGWTTVFSDDFNGASGTGLDRSNWLYDTGTGYNYPGAAGNWGTGELETATDSTTNVYQDGAGHLVIKPVRNAAGQWTSGRIETQRTDFAAPAGGQLEISASLQQPNPQSGLGYWPAFWAMGAAARPVGATNWPGIGEMDIMEDVNALSQHSTTFHCGVWAGECHDPDGISSGLQACAGCQTGYHTYSVIVDRTNTAAEQLRFYLDGALTYTVNENEVSTATWQAAVDHGFFAIFDVAIGGSYPNKVCGCTSPSADITSGAGMSVDWFAVYQTGSGSSGTTGGTTTGGTTTGGTTTGGTATGGTTGGGTTTPDFTENATRVDASHALISFTPTTAAAYVDVHYLVNGAGQQNFRMADNGGTWTQTVGSLTAGSVLTYWFTYEKSGPQYDSPHYTYTQS